MVAAGGTGPTAVGPQSAIRFLYPFAYDGASLPERAARLEQLRWEGSRNPLTVWRSEAFPTEDLLSHVAAFLEPPPGMPRAACLLRMDPDALRSPSGLGGGRQHPGAEWTLHSRGGDIDFSLDGAELALFAHGIGFVTVSARPCSDQPDVWFDFLHHFRFVAGERAPRVSAARVASEGGGTEPRRVAYFPLVVGGRGAGGGDNGHRHFGEVLVALLMGAADTTVVEETTEPAPPMQWWEEIFVPGMMLPYASLFIDGVHPDRRGEVLHRVRNFFHSHQDVHVAPSPQPADAGLLDYADAQWFFFSLNGGGFVAFDAPLSPFFRETLPHHLASQYFLLFLLALEQRFLLMVLSEQVARRWVAGESDDDIARTEAFTRIRDTLLAFTAQGYFAQTMQQDHHHRCYARWQQTFQLAQMYEQVGAEVRDMYGYLDLRQRERAEADAKRAQEQRDALERRLSLVTWLFGVPVWLFLLFNSTVNVAAIRHLVFGEPALQWYDPLVALGLDALGVGMALAVYILVRRSITRHRS